MAGIILTVFQQRERVAAEQSKSKSYIEKKK
jgi:hypothetical protein